jgi:hypothetical protein
MFRQTQPYQIVFKFKIKRGVLYKIPSLDTERIKGQRQTGMMKTCRCVPFV